MASGPDDPRPPLADFPFIQRLFLGIMLGASGALAVAVILYQHVLYDTSRINLSAIALVATLLLVTAYGASVILVIRLQPRPVPIALLGLPSSGKTVFLTVLFDQLGRRNVEGIAFAPYGSESIERVHTDLQTMLGGDWLPPTGDSDVFYYRANASIGMGPFRKRLKVEIGDYAGENVSKLQESDTVWLHRSEYFKYVRQSDALLLAVDSWVLRTRSESEVQKMESSLIAALQVLMDRKGVAIGGKLRLPVAIVFMKCDILPRGEWEQLSDRLPSLMSFCESKCAASRVFMTSSVGSVGEDGLPPRRLTPVGVCEPLIWALRRAT